MKTFTIALPDDLAELVEEHVKAGRYADVSAFFEDLVRWDQEEGEPPWVVAALLEGIDSAERGENIPATPEFWEQLRAEVQQRVQQKRGEVA